MVKKKKQRSDKRTIHPSSIPTPSYSGSQGSAGAFPSSLRSKSEVTPWNPWARNLRGVRRATAPLPLNFKIYILVVFCYSERCIDKMKWSALINMKQSTFWPSKDISDMFYRSLRFNQPLGALTCSQFQEKVKWLFKQCPETDIMYNILWRKQIILFSEKQTQFH